MNIQIERVNLNNIKDINNIESSLKQRVLSYNILSSTLNSENYYYFVAKINDKIIGYMAAELLVDHFDILAVAVLQEYRRQNIATLLINKLIEICLALNIQDIFLEVRCSNLPAIKFYEKVNFKKINIRKNYYTDTNEDAYIYKIVV